MTAGKNRGVPAPWKAAAWILGFASLSLPLAARQPSEKERLEVEKVIESSIGWALTKDRQRLLDAVSHDEDFFVFHPDSASTVTGYESFRAMVDEVFMDPRFKATDFKIKDLRIQCSPSGDAAWYSALLDDHGTWDGRPTGWDDARWTGVLEKRGGVWVLVQMHFSIAQDALSPEISKREAWAAVQAIYAGWTAGNPDALGDLVHPAAAASGPSGGDRAEGREAVLRRFAERLQGAKARSFALSREHVQLLGLGDTAVATFTYEISTEKDGKAGVLNGTEMMVLVRRSGKWRLVADHTATRPYAQDPHSGVRAADRLGREGR
jgi:ketosteroid isomerase-like protein